MQTLKKYIGYLLKGLDAILMVLSPLMIVLFIISVIMGIDYSSANMRLVKALEQKGVVTTATVNYISIRLDSITVDLTAPDGSTVNGYLDLKYYSEEVIQSLSVGDKITVRYVPGINNYPIDLVLEQHFDQVRGYMSLALRQVIIMGLVSWGIIITHPEFLYIGYGKEFTALTQMRLNG